MFEIRDKALELSVDPKLVSRAKQKPTTSFPPKTYQTKTFHTFLNGLQQEVTKP